MKAFLPFALILFFVLLHSCTEEENFLIEEDSLQTEKEVLTETLDGSNKYTINFDQLNEKESLISFFNQAGEEGKKDEKSKDRVHFIFSLRGKYID